MHVSAKISQPYSVQKIIAQLADKKLMYLTNRFTLLLSTLIGALPMIASPGDSGTPAPTATPGGQVMVDLPPSQYMPKWLKIGGQIRGRFENTSGTSLLNSSSDAYYLSRIRINVAVNPTPWLRFFVQAQDARVAAYNTAPASTTYYNPMDLRQGYVEMNYEGAVSAKFRAGRQELVSAANGCSAPPIGECRAPSMPSIWRFPVAAPEWIFWPARPSRSTIAGSTAIRPASISTAPTAASRTSCPR